jgi:hypothetical protein
LLRTAVSCTPRLLEGWKGRGKEEEVAPTFLFRFFEMSLKHTERLSASKSANVQAFPGETDIFAETAGDDAEHRSLSAVYCTCAKQEIGIDKSFVQLGTHVKRRDTDHQMVSVPGEVLQNWTSCTTSICVAS